MSDLLSKEFIESIGALSQAVAQQQDSAAAMLYRLMFRHERDINVLDRYADQVLEGVSGMGSQYAEEDYLNYLQYLATVLPHEVKCHKEMYDEDMARLAEDEAEMEEYRKGKE